MEIRAWFRGWLNGSFCNVNLKKLKRALYDEAAAVRKNGGHNKWIQCHWISILEKYERIQ